MRSSDLYKHILSWKILVLLYLDLVSLQNVCVCLCECERMSERASE